MSSPFVCYPETPTLQPAPVLRAGTPNIFSDAFESLSGSSSSSAHCPCCATPPFVESDSFAALEHQFVSSVTIYSTGPFRTQAVAVIPQDRRAAGHWPLIDLLCHRTFALFGDQDGVRKLSIFHYQRFGPGDNLLITARQVTQGSLTWLEATVTRDDMLVATAIALYDRLPPQTSDPWIGGSDDLVTGFDGLSTSSIAEEA